MTHGDYKKCNSRKVRELRSATIPILISPAPIHSAAHNLYWRPSAEVRDQGERRANEPRMARQQTNRRGQNSAVKGDAAENGGAPAGAKKVEPPISASAKKVERSVEPPAQPLISGFSAQKQNNQGTQAYLPSLQMKSFPKGEKRRIGFLTSQIQTAPRKEQSSSG